MKEGGWHLSVRLCVEMGKKREGQKRAEGNERNVGCGKSS
jgi:hypothetical protein